MLKLRLFWSKFFYILVMLIGYIFLMVSCNSVQETTAVQTETSTSEPATEVSITNPTVQPSSTSTIISAAVTPETSPTKTMMPTVTPVPTTIATDNSSVLPIEPHCSSQELNDNLGAEVTAGLMLFGNWDDKTTIGTLGSDGLATPLYLLPSEPFFSGESPDRKAFVYFEQNGELRISLIDAANMEILTEGLFEDIELAFSIRPIRWEADGRIVIALANEGELYRWLIWAPFEDHRELLEVELEGIGNVRERFRTAVSFDPLLEYIIYPCEDCPPDEYLVKNMLSGEMEWTIDLGENPGSLYRGFPHWSPDGQYIAIVSGDFERTTWVFNRQGEIVYQIEGGSLNMSWSPDSRYLAFGRDNENPLNGENYSVTLLDLVNNTLIDLCVNPNPPSVPIYWSWDSSKIAFGNQVSELDNPKTSIYIVDINSGDKVELSSEEEDYRIEGWVNID